MSTLNRTGEPCVTEMTRRCSPRVVFLNTTSCGPIVSGMFPIGVSPMLSPSIDTVAQGIALMETVPFGSVTSIADTRPGVTWNVRVSR